MLFLYLLCPEAKSLAGAGEGAWAGSDHMAVGLQPDMRGLGHGQGHCHGHCHDHG